MMLKAQIPVAAGNAGIVDGKLAEVVQKTMERVKPEAAYFGTEDGMRTAFMFFDMADSSDIPGVAEPFFQGLEAAVSFQPVMNPEDLQRGLGQV